MLVPTDQSESMAYPLLKVNLRLSESHKLARSLARSRRFLSNFIMAAFSPTIAVKFRDLMGLITLIFLSQGCTPSFH